VVTDGKGCAADRGHEPPACQPWRSLYCVASRRVAIIFVRSLNWTRIFQRAIRFHMSSSPKGILRRDAGRLRTSRAQACAPRLAMRDPSS